jgi:hypothetical protein
MPVYRTGKMSSEATYRGSSDISRGNANSMRFVGHCQPGLSFTYCSLAIWVNAGTRFSALSTRRAMKRQISYLNKRPKSN